MKIKRLHPLTIGLLAALVATGLGMVNLPGPDAMLGATIGLRPVSANAKYGILGRSAPELVADHWIDGDGDRMAPIRLEDYRGKAVYLYFFQDW